MSVKMTTNKTLSERLSGNAEGLTQFIAQNGTKIGMSVALVASVALVVGFVAYAGPAALAQASQQLLLEGAKAGVGTITSGLLLSSGSKLMSRLTKDVLPGCLDEGAVEKDGKTIIESGPSAIMEAKSIFSGFTDDIKMRFARVARGSALEAIIPKQILDCKQVMSLSNTNNTGFSM